MYLRNSQHSIKSKYSLQPSQSPPLVPFLSQVQQTFSKPISILFVHQHLRLSSVMLFSHFQSKMRHVFLVPATCFTSSTCLILCYLIAPATFSKQNKPRSSPLCIFPALLSPPPSACQIFPSAPCTEIPTIHVLLLQQVTQSGTWGCTGKEEG